MVTCTTNITLELILQEAPDILDEVDEAPIFSAEPKRMFPSFARNEIKLGKVLGIGGFGVVREVAKIDFANKSSRPINFTIPKETENSQGEEGSLTDIFAFEKDMTDKDDQTSFIMSFEDSMGDGLHYEVSTARETMARRCIRRGEARYAVKALMKEDLTETEYARGRIDLAIEVKYLQALNHPNIVKMRGLFDTDDLVHPHYFFLMDRLYGTLGDRIKEWQIDDKKHRGGIFNKSDKKLMKSLLIKRLTVAYDIVSAVKYMHSCKLVYRDMKPENIGFDIRGDVKVFDFGLAKSLHPKLKASDGLYQLTSRAGSIPYMAPEVAKLENYNERCDVFSFGIMFWEIVSLKQPFPLLKKRRDFYKKVVVKGSRPPIPFRKWSPTIQQVMKSSWKTLPKDRPSMKDISTMLHDELNMMKKNEDMNLRSQLLKTKSVLSIGFSTHSH